MDDEGAIAEDLRLARARGIARLVDVTSIGMGRDVPAALRLCADAGMQAIFSTGFYKEPFLPAVVQVEPEEGLTKLMVREVVEGIEGADVKAQVIGEVGTGAEIAPLERKVLRAASAAQAETGVPIYTHTTLGRLGLEQVGIMRQSGAILKKVVIGHVDLCPDLDYCLRLLDCGVYLGFDTVGKEKYQPDSVRARAIAALVGRGRWDKIVLSTDITRKSHLREFGGYGRAYLIDAFVPMLLEEGISERQVDVMLSDTPGALFPVGGDA